MVDVVVVVLVVACSILLYFSAPLSAPKTQSGAQRSTFKKLEGDIVIVRARGNSCVLCRTLALGTSVCFKEAGWGSATLRHLTPFRATENRMLRCVACVLFWKCQLLQSCQLSSTTSPTASSAPVDFPFWCWGLSYESVNWGDQI